MNSAKAWEYATYGPVSCTALSQGGEYLIAGSQDGNLYAFSRDGELLWHESEALPDFAEKLGQNTDYTIHPEEAMADNFMFLVSGRKVPNPALLQRIKAVLQAPAGS